MSVSAKLSRYVSATIRERGRDYFYGGFVKLGAVTPRGVTATVEGTDTYDVDLSLEGDTVYAHCTCPYADTYAAPCKHIWATILAADTKGFANTPAYANRTLTLRLDGLDPDDEDLPVDNDSGVIAVPAPRPPASRPPGPPPVPRWADQFDAIRRQIAAVQPHVRENGPERQPLYVFDVPTSVNLQKLVLEVMPRQRKLNGEWGKPKAQSMSPHHVAALPNPLDRQILALLGGADRDGYYSGYSYSSGTRYRLDGALLATVLPMLARTGPDQVRAKLDPRSSDLIALTPDPGPPWELAVGVAPVAGGTGWVLSGKLMRPGETLPLTKPLLLVPGLVVWDGRFAGLDDAGAFPWAVALRRQGDLTVPAGNADDFVRELVQMPRLPRFDLPAELKYTEEPVAPRPRLTVKPGPGYGSNPVLHAELAFDYDGSVVPAQPIARGVYQSEKRRFVLRDPAAEKAAAQDLARRGLRPAWTTTGQALEVKPAQLPKLVRELVAAGWQVVADGKVYRTPGAFTLAVKSGRDWFDLDGAADFGGLSVSLPRLLEALSRGDTSIVLGDGSLGVLPEEWLKKYGLLAKVGMVEGDSVRFSRAQVGVLDALLAARPEVTFDKQFAKARDELRKFQGVTAADPPKSFTGELREYQREGLGWMKFLRKFGFGGCLADDMGLGKTVQVLAYLAGKRAGPALVVVPRSLVFNWQQEAAKFAPKLRVLDHSTPLRDKTTERFPEFDVILTTYGILRKDAELLAGFHFDTCILDESQAAKNAETDTAKAVKLIDADHRLALSGTPVENHLGELWTLFDFLNPGMLGRAALLSGAVGRTIEPETRDLLAKALRPYILRRTKQQVAKDLPAKTEQTVYCDLEPAQRKLYDELRTHYRQSLLSRVDDLGLARSKIQVLEALLRLRQAACHPGLLDKARAGDDSAKLDVLLPKLREAAEEGHKTLVFSQFTALLGIVKARLDADGVRYEYLDGKTRDRDARVKRFQTDPACRVFLISLKAGGVGLNLTAAEYVFLLDPWWNPAAEAQAIDRSHRIGQTKPVFAYRLIAKDTVEEKVLALQQSKRELADAILGGDGRLITDLKREDLELLLS